MPNEFSAWVKCFELYSAGSTGHSIFRKTQITSKGERTVDMLDHRETIDNVNRTVELFA
jgi:hypothetical protein